jgi:hypothetical protein
MKRGHMVAWMAPGKDRLATPEHVDAGELAVFEPDNTAIDVYANEDSEFVLGSAVAHPPRPGPWLVLCAHQPSLAGCGRTANR